MTISRLLLTLSWLLFSCLVFSQVTVKGELRLGDTTQVHILYTKDGDRLQGRVTGFDNDKVVFLFKNQNTLFFPFAEISSIEVQPEEQPAVSQEKINSGQTASSLEFFYLATLRDGTKTSGRVSRCDSRSVRLTREQGPDDYLYWQNIDTLVLVSQPINKSGAGKGVIHVLKTSRGDQFIGQLQDYGMGTLRFMLENGTILKFSLKDIVNIRLEERVAQNEPIPVTGVESWGNDKLLFTQSAFLLKRKETQYRNLMVLYNAIDHGISDHITIGGGFLTVIFTSIVSVRAKAGFDLNDYVHVGVGGQAFGAFLFDEEVAGAAFGYGALTFGTSDRHLNIGVGRGVGFDLDNPITSFNLGGAFRLGNNWRIFGEYLVIRDETSDGGIYGGLGGSWFNLKHRIDFGFALFQDDFSNSLIPAAGYVFRF